MTRIYANAQDYYFKHYQTENGLSHNAVFASLQDRNGFLWFGTMDGLNRFDGYNFKVFRRLPNDPTSIGNNNIRCLTEDKNGKIWVGTNEGLFIYDPMTESFQQFKEGKSMEILDIKFDLNGNLWFIGNFDLFTYNYKHKQLKTYSKNRFFEATEICVTKNNSIWVGTHDGKIQRYNWQDDNFETFNIFSNPKNTSLKLVTKILDTNNGYLLIGGAKQGLKSFNLDTYESTNLLTNHETDNDLYVKDIIQYSENEYWIASENGLYIYNAITNTFKNLKKQYNNPWYLSDNAIYTLLKDKEGGLWIGTYFGGVNFYPKDYTPFEKHFPISGENSLTGNAVREIHPDQYGNLWIGTEDGGLNKLDTTTNKFSNFKAGDKPEEIANNNIHGLLLTGDTLWIGNLEQGLDLMNIKTGKVIKHYSSPEAFGSNFILAILQTSDKKILLVSARGLYIYHPEQKKFSLVKNVPEYIFYTSIFEDSKGNVWLGTWRDGLYTFNFKSDSSKVYKYDPNNSNSLSNNRINSIFEDSNKNIWVATEEGLSKLNKDLQSFRRYTTLNNFPSNLIYMIMEDENLNLWITTSKGLVYLNPVTQEQRVFTKANGLLSDQFNYNSAYKGPNGKMYFGGVKGMISFNPKSFLRNTNIPPVFITGFQVYNKELKIASDGSPLTKSIMFTDTIVLKSQQSSFSIDFAAISYTSPTMTEYAYKMEGLDKDWTYLKTNRKAFFTELPPGVYTFKVNAYNSSGTRRGKEAKLTIEILPPFWKSHLAYSLYAIILTLVIICGFRRYHFTLKLKNKRKLIEIANKKEKDLYNAKIDFFTNIAHEIRTPLTLIKGPMEKIMDKAQEIPSIKNNLIIMDRNTNRLLELTNQLLDFRKTEKDGFITTFSRVDISDILQDVYSRFKPTAKQKKLIFNISMPSKPIYAVLDKESLEKIISNLISNAIKYADKEILITLKLIGGENNTHFEIKVKNDGYLIPNSMSDKIFEAFFRLPESKPSFGTGLGLPLSRSLAQLQNGTLTFNPSDNNLNVFILILPLQQNQDQQYDNTNIVEKEINTHE